MPRQKKIEDQPLERLIEMIDEQVKLRGEANLAVQDTTARIAELASEARGKGVTNKDLLLHVQRMDLGTRKLVPVSRQALDTLVAVHDKRREPRTTRASRRRRDVESAPAGTLNTEAFG